MTRLATDPAAAAEALIGLPGDVRDREQLEVIGLGFWFVGRLTARLSGQRAWVADELEGARLASYLNELAGASSQDEELMRDLLRVYWVADCGIAPTEGWPVRCRRVQQAGLAEDLSLIIALVLIHQREDGAAAALAAEIVAVRQLGAPGHLALVNHNARIGKLELALEQLDASGADGAVERVARAMLLVRLQRYADAMEVLGSIEGIEDVRVYAQLLHVTGVFAAVAGDYESAVGYLERAARGLPDSEVGKTLEEVRELR